MGLKYGIKKQLAVYAAQKGIQKMEVILAIANQLGVDQRTIYNYMAIKADDDRELDDRTLGVFAKVLESEVADLVTEVRFS